LKLKCINRHFKYQTFFYWIGLYLGLWVRGEVGEEGKEGNGRDYTRDRRYKEMLGRTSILEVYFRNSKFMARNPVYQGMDFGVKIALKRVYEHLEHKTTKQRASAFLKIKFYVKNAKIAGKKPIAA
jgi:hypothetical protein